MSTIILAPEYAANREDRVKLPLTSTSNLRKYVPRPPHDLPTMWDSVRFYLDQLHVLKGCASLTVTHYRRLLTRHVRFLENLGIGSFSEVKSGHVFDFFSRWFSRDRVCVNTFIQARLILSNFYSHLVKNALIDRNPLDDLMKPRASHNRRLPTILTTCEIRKIFDVFRSNNKISVRNRAIIELMYGSGLRVGEVLSLELSNLSMNDGFVKVLGKGSKERIVPVIPSTRNALSIYMKIRRSFKGSDSSPLLFLATTGSPLTRTAVWVIVKRATKKAGIEKRVHPHTFRHSCATHLMEEGANLRVIQELLGHESIETTQIYMQLSKQQLKEVMLRCHPRSKARDQLSLVYNRHDSD